MEKKILKKKLQKDTSQRITCSFYCYVNLENLQDLRHKIYEDFFTLGILGRVYLAKEGINAQISIPKEYYSLF